MNMFEPQLFLSREKDGEYTLHAVTITPNSCYSAGRARRGAPPNVRLLPNVQPVLLDIRVRSGPCLQVLTPVKHRLRNLELDEHAKRSVLAFVTLNGHVTGSASIQVGGRHCVTEEPHVETSDWYAWVNRQPPGGPRMHVKGTVHLPTPGYYAELAVASPQGINPSELILDLRLEEKPGYWPEVITPVSVRYDLDAATISYQTVLIRSVYGESVQLEVEEVF